MTKIVVTGAGGFIGWHVVTRLRSEGHEVAAYTHETADICKPFEFPEGYDVVIHCAGNARMFWSVGHLIEDFTVNALGTLHALNATLKAKIKKFIFLSTSAIDEPVPYTPYVLSKLAAESYVKYYRDTYKLDTLIIRPTKVFGPGMKKNVIYDLIEAHIARKPLKLEYKPSSVFDFLYIDDLVEGLCWFATHTVEQCYSTWPLVYSSFRGSVEAINDLINLITGYECELVVMPGALEYTVAEDWPSNTGFSEIEQRLRTTIAWMEHR